MSNNKSTVFKWNMKNVTAVEVGVERRFRLRPHTQVSAHGPRKLIEELYAPNKCPHSFFLYSSKWARIHPDGPRMAKENMPSPMAVS